MVKLRMSPIEMHDMFVFNGKRRETLLNEALQQGSAEDQLKFVVDYFLNKLPPSVIAKIDGESEDSIMPFKYDYSFLEDYKSFDSRRREDRRWGSQYGVSLPQVDNDIRGTEKIKIYPALYALKMGTCNMFASEIQRFAYDFGIESQIVEKMEYCYDKFDGFSTENREIHTDRLIKMLHFYNIVSIGGKKYKIDIAGFLTAQDFNRNHPGIRVDENKFYFSEKHKDNPFSKFTKFASRAVINFPEESQPQ